MNHVQIRWIVVGSLALALSGCEVHKCTDEDREDGGRCADLFDDDEDAGDEDAGASDGGASDGGRADGGRMDGGADGGTDGSAADGGGADGGGGEVLTLEQFCEAQLVSAVAWRDAIGSYCDDDSFPELDAFLLSTLLYSDDAIDRCIAALTSSNITFDGSRAAACAEAYASQYEEPPASFADGGIDLSMYSATIGHGAAELVQLSECRAALKGKLVRDAVCANSFECVDGLRCRSAPGDTRTCQPALNGGVCVRNSDCEDDYTCVGNDTSGGKTCIPSDDLPLTGNCGRSLECGEGRICGEAGRCVAPTSNVICEP